jgi:hypothetical protein
MKSVKRVLVCIFCSVFSIAHSKDVELRRNIHFSNLQVLDFDESKIQLLLRSKGYEIDEKTIIQYHEEKGIVDLSCFNCIVIDVNAEDAISGSRNERTLK